MISCVVMVSMVPVMFLYSYFDTICFKKTSVIFYFSILQYFLVNVKPYVALGYTV